MTRPKIEPPSPTPATTTLDEKALETAIDSARLVMPMGDCECYRFTPDAVATAIRVYLSALPVPPSGEVNGVKCCPKCGSISPGVHWHPCAHAPIPATQGESNG